ncbi:hypothetical protein WJX73_002235 [Symbiochloris irregularis]|uniref:Uncharacterized protein n=1 Tax=Symbiochloris irregularis TaxID=706552 RepID=A0AAW1NHZ8_9CHLO
MPQQLKDYLKTAEGRYTLLHERSGTSAYNPSRSTRLTFASLPDGPEAGEYIIFSLSASLLICRYNNIKQLPVRTIPAGGGAGIVPTCHDFCRASDGFDLLCGVSSGDVLLTSLRGQIGGASEGGAAPRSAPVQAFNDCGQTDPTRCIAVHWLHNTSGAAFIAAHASGHVYLYHKGVTEAGSSRDSSRQSTPRGSSPARQPVMTIHATPTSLTDAVPSPNGAYVATTARDGLLRVHDLATGVLVAGFQGYYGGLLCCAWTPDSAYVAAGGEDDLVSVYGMSERALVSWGSGHLSWISRLAFDPWQWQKPEAGGSRTHLRTLSGNQRTQREKVYRLCSVGQDCRLLLWDLIVPCNLPPAFPSSSSPGATPPTKSSTPALQPETEDAPLPKENNPASGLGARSSSGMLRLPILGTRSTWSP